MKWIHKNSILLGLIVFGLLCLGGAVTIFSIEKIPVWAKELGNALMTLSATIVFGGIIKLLFEDYQNKKSDRENVKDFKKDLLGQLRNVFDKVNNAQLLIKAHKSAKTYGEQIRFEIIPCVTTLYEIKRSMVATYAMEDMSEQKILELRINIHYMVAYLQVLIHEYSEHYPTISHRQYLHEEVKKRQRDVFVFDLMEANVRDYFSDDLLTSEHFKNQIKEPPLWVWRAILELKHIGKFIEDAHGSPYRKMFVDFYERTKRILKGEKELKKPSWYRETHLNEMLRIDEASAKGESKEDDNLVAILMKYIENESMELKN